MPPTVQNQFTLQASWDTATGTSVDDQRDFDQPTELTLPGELPVTKGLAGNGTASLSFHSATTCSDVICTYRGGSHTAMAATLLDKFLGRMYALQSCSDGSAARSTLAVTSIRLHVDSGDTGVGRSDVMLIAQSPDPVSTTPPPDAGAPEPVVTPIPALPSDHYPGSEVEPSEPSEPQTSPMINGEYAPQAFQPNQ